MNIELGQLIGSGNFGEVYKGLWRKRFVVAVKTLKVNEQEKRNVKKEDAKKEEFRKELEIMKKLRHEKLVKLWCVCTIGKQELFMITFVNFDGDIRLAFILWDYQTHFTVINFKDLFALTRLFWQSLITFVDFNALVWAKFNKYCICIRFQAHKYTYRKFFRLILYGGTTRFWKLSLCVCVCAVAQHGENFGQGK